MPTPPRFPPGRIALTYAAFAVVWIVLGDTLQTNWEASSSTEWANDVGKGLVFVALSTVGLYWLMRREEKERQAIIRALQVSEERWETALECAGDGLWDWNVQTGDVFFSRQWKAMLGHAESEIANRLEEWEARVHPDDRELTEAAVRDHLEGRVSNYESVHRLRAKDGSYRWIRDRGRVVERTVEGKPLRMVGTHTDVTDARLAAERMADELAFTQAIFDNSPVGIISYRTDGQAVSANAAAARIVGGTVEELRAQNFRQLDSWRRSGLLAAAEQAIAGATETRCETELTTTFGRKLWASSQFVPFQYRGEQRLLLMLRDVSERRKALAQHHLLRSALEAAPMGIVITDAQGTIEWVNPAFTRLTGHDVLDVIGRNPRVLKSNRHPPEFYAQLWATIAGGQVWSGEIVNSRRDGSVYTEHMTIAPVRDDVGQISHFVAIKQDVSERKDLELQLARTQRLESIGMLASGIAHDLNNIFAPILLSLELLKIKYPTADGRKTLELIEQTGQRGAAIVKQVLAFARGIEGERAEVQPRYLIKELSAMLRETLPRQIAVKVEVAAGMPLVSGNSTQLHQVLLNLAINARDAMPAGGVLTLGARVIEVDESWRGRHPELRPGPHVALSVTDTGTGIPADVLEHVFEPFFSTKPRGQGTGLGLSTVYGIVKSHGGAIEVATRLGAGTTFTVMLPVASSASTGTPSAGSSPPMAETCFGGGRRLLVVDDEESIRLVMLHALQRHGFVVETAIDGAEALEIFRGAPGRFSAVVTDLMMPRMNGRDLVREIRRLDTAVPIVACSGLTDGGGKEPGDKAVLAACGVKTLMRKPFTEGELLDALEAEFRPPPP